MLAVQSWKTTREEAEVDGPGGRMEEDGLSAAVLYYSALLFLKDSFIKTRERFGKICKLGYVQHFFLKT
jgi:hypothetical protein